MTAATSNGCHCKITRLRRTSKRCSVSLHPSENGGCCKIIRITIRPPRSRRPKSWDKIQDSVVPLERNLYGFPEAGLQWERQFQKVLVAVISLSPCGRHEKGRKEERSKTNVVQIDEISGTKEQSILGLYAT